jgi:hypothetical protein
VSTKSTRRPPTAITCEGYAPGSDDKRCRYYIAKGGCTLSSEACVEWAKVNRRPTTSTPETRTRVIPPTELPAVPSLAIPVPTSITTDDIASFRALGVQICFQSDELGELWLVPSYTGQARKEITPEHAATLGHVLAVFPGAQVTAFQSASPAIEGSST